MRKGGSQWGQSCPGQGNTGRGRCRRKRGSHAVGHAGPITKTLSARQWPYQPAFHTRLINWEDWEEDGVDGGDGGKGCVLVTSSLKWQRAGQVSQPPDLPLTSVKTRPRILPPGVKREKKKLPGRSILERLD